MSSHTIEAYRPRVLITGEKGGTGSSTTAKLLAELFHLPVISGGKYFRPIAEDFHNFQMAHPQLTPAQQYRDFLRRYQKIYKSKNGLTKILELGKTIDPEGGKGPVVATFGAAIAAKEKRSKGKVDPLWDHIVDQASIKAALDNPGFIWEAKLSVLAYHLDEMQKIINEYQALAYPFLSVLLTVSDEIAAQRIGQRENREVDGEEVATRRKRDFGRFGRLYRINKQPVVEEHLHSLTDLRIDTSDMSPEEVIGEVLESYLNKLAYLRSDTQRFSPDLIQQLEDELLDARTQLEAQIFLAKINSKSKLQNPETTGSSAAY